MTSDIKIFAGSSGQAFAQGMCDALGVPLGRSDVRQFSDGNLFVRVGESIRGGDAYLVLPIALKPNDEFTELLFWMDAFKRASANSVTAIIPYFGYAKGDKKDEPRVSIRGRVCADAIQAAGVDRVVTLDLHAPQVQGFFTLPVDDLYALPVLCDAVAAKGLTDLVVVAPDAGYAKKARQWANRLHAPTAIADKRRVDHTESAEVVELIGEVAGRTALIVDDFTITAGTLTDAARVLIERGATDVYAAVSHALLTGPANERLDASPIRQLLTTDSVETQPAGLSAKVEVVSVGGLFAEAIRRIAARESVSVLFR